MYELPSTSTKEKRFCPFWWENFVFQSVWYFSNFVGFKATYFQFFSIEFFGRVVKAPFRFPEEHIMETTNLKQPFFLKPYFLGFWTKSTRTFHKIFLADFKKTVLLVQKNSLWKSLRQKKELINKTISRNLFWQLSDFCWNFSGRFVKTVFYLRVTFWWKAAFASEILIGNFFLDIGRKLSRFWRYCFRHSFTNCFLRAWKEIIVNSNYWAKTLVFKVFANLHDLTDS